MKTKSVLFAFGSALALASCASDVERQGAVDDPYRAALYTGAAQPDGADHYAKLYAPEQTSANGTPFELASYAGIEGARRAHQLYTEEEAEALDGRCERYVKPSETESLIDVANLCDVKLDTLVAYNPDLKNVSYANAGAVIEIPGGVVNPQGSFAMAGALSDLYAVEKGDTAEKIAYRFNVSTASIINANPGVDWTTLSEGQVIKKPAPVAASAPSGANYSPPAPEAAWEGYSGAVGIGASSAAGVTAHAPYALKPVRSYARPAGVYPEAKLAVDKAFVKPGDSVEVTAYATPGADVTFYSGDEPGDLKKSKTVRADDSGKASARITVKKKSNAGGVVFGAREDGTSTTQYSDRVGVVTLKENSGDSSGDDETSE